MVRRLDGFVSPFFLLALVAVSALVGLFLGLEVLTAGPRDSATPLLAGDGARNRYVASSQALAEPSSADLEPIHARGASPANQALVRQLFGNLPLYFVENRGQLDEQVRYYVKGRDKTLYLTADGVTISIQGGDQRWAVKLDFVDGNPHVAPRGEDRQQAVFSYFKGSDPEKWRTGCPTYARIVYEDLWPGIDLVFRGTANRLKHEFLVEPGADAGRIRIALRGASEVRLDDECDLVVGTPLGAFEDARPVAYQVREGRRVEVEAGFDLDPARSPAQAAYGFALGGFDQSLPLVLDPEMIVYSGFLGGTYNDTGYSIAVDASGAAYVTGYTESSDFPTVGGLDPSFNGITDVFVAKVDPAGSALVYSGFLGGSDSDLASGIAVDAGGAAYLTGRRSPGTSRRWGGWTQASTAPWTPSWRRWTRRAPRSRTAGSSGDPPTTRAKASRWMRRGPRT